MSLFRAAVFVFSLGMCNSDDKCGEYISAMCSKVEYEIDNKGVWPPPTRVGNAVSLMCSIHNFSVTVQSVAVQFIQCALSVVFALLLTVPNTRGLCKAAWPKGTAVVPPLSQ
jgi:hypothetical protein